MMRAKTCRAVPTVVPALALGIALAAWAPTANGDTTAAFTFVGGDVSVNTAASFNDSGPGSTGAVFLDPNDPSTMWVYNRALPPNPPSGTAGTGGAYVYNLTTHKRLTNTAGNIYLSSNNVPGLQAWDNSGDPYAGMVGTDGSLYMLFNAGSANYTSGLWKISNPTSDTPTATSLFGNYNNTASTADDDPSYLAPLPASFVANNPELAGYSTNDILMLDSGIDANNVTALVAVHADGSDGTSPTVLWQRPTPGANTSRGGLDARNGYFYFIQTAPEANAIGGTSYPSLYRMNAAGDIQTIGLKLPSGASVASLDDAIAVNPADGSVWLVNIDAAGTTNRSAYRVDVANAADQGGNQFIAPVTTEFTATGFNLGVNSLAFSPDGKILYGGTPDGTDKIWAFNVLVHNPGDANGDGVLNGDDYALLDKGYSDHLTGWSNGDFNDDGIVDSADYLILDTAYGRARGTLDPDLLSARAAAFGPDYVAALVAAVPEPASLGCLVASLSMFVASRRRRPSPL